MPKRLQESALSTRNARSKLNAGLHWRGLNADVHLGYRKSRRAGRWIVRWYLGRQKYRQETLAVADDALDADGRDCLSYEQAKSRALAKVGERRIEARAAAHGPVATVRSVVEAYIAVREAREQGYASGKHDARTRLSKHVLSTPIADVPLHALSERDLTRWREGLPSSLVPGTVRRLINDFKAALNAAALKHRAAVPADLTLTIKNAMKLNDPSPPVARDKQALSDQEIRRLIEAARQVDNADRWDGDLLRVIVVLAATGSRFSQVTRLSVGDVQVDQQRIMVPVSRKGRTKKTKSHIAMPIGSDVIAFLLPVITARRPNEPLLERWRHRQVPGTRAQPPHWVRDQRSPWLNASELVRPLECAPRRRQDQAAVLTECRVC